MKEIPLCHYSPYQGKSNQFKKDTLVIQTRIPFDLDDDAMMVLIAIHTNNNYEVLTIHFRK